MPSLYFYLRPFDNEVTISSEPSPSGIWYAIWPRDGQLTWSAHPPVLLPGQVGACVVAYHEPRINESPLGGGAKEIPPPPWLQLQGKTFTDYASFSAAVAGEGGIYGGTRRYDMAGKEEPTSFGGTRSLDNPSAG